MTPSDNCAPKSDETYIELTGTGPRRRVRLPIERSFRPDFYWGSALDGIWLGISIVLLLAAAAYGYYEIHAYFSGGVCSAGKRLSAVSSDACVSNTGMAGSMVLLIGVGIFSLLDLMVFGRRARNAKGPALAITKDAFWYFQLERPIAWTEIADFEEHLARNGAPSRWTVSTKVPPSLVFRTSSNWRLFDATRRRVSIPTSYLFVETGRSFPEYKDAADAMRFLIAHGKASGRRLSS